MVVKKGQIDRTRRELTGAERMRAPKTRAPMLVAHGNWERGWNRIYAGSIRCPHRACGWFGRVRQLPEVKQCPNCTRKFKVA